MRFRLLRRRLTISAPRVAVRSALPWPVRWLVLAVVFGFCAAVALWAFEFGRSIAGLEAGSREELVRLRDEVAQLREQTQQQQAVANTAHSILTAERSANEVLKGQMRQLEAENRALREDLGFFEKLIPSARGEGLAIRSLQAERVAEDQLRWQVLVMQPQRNAPEFSGRLELQLQGLLDGQPWSHAVPAQALQLRQYRRVEGLQPVPPGAVVKTVTARVLDGTAVRSTQTATLD